jgi:hypothetical protein
MRIVLTFLVFEDVSVAAKEVEAFKPNSVIKAIAKTIEYLFIFAPALSIS